LFEDEFPPDREIADTILVMQKQAEQGMDEVIGFAKLNISKEGQGAQNAIGNLVCEAMLQSTNADFAFLNLGGVRDELQKGPITYRNIFNVMPFDNQIVSFTVDGKFLKEIIEMRVSGSRHGLRVAGVKVIYSKTREDYDRVTSLMIGGKPWKADKMYKITTTDFLLQGNAGLTMLTKIPENQIERAEINLRDVIVDYIKTNSPVENKIDDRWKREDNSELYYLNLATKEYEIQPAYSHKTNYARNIHSLYTLYAGETGNFGYQGGLRGEYTWRNIESTGESMPFTIDRWDIFPTLHISYNLPKENQVMGSYARRIERPRGWYLEPFLTWTDAYNVRQGNPELQPEYIDSYEIAYLKKFDKNFVSLESYYRVTHNKTERVRSVYSENVMLSTIENVGEDYSLGIEFMLNYKVFKWWQFDLMANFYKYKVEGVLYDVDFSNESNKFRKFSLNLCLHGQFPPKFLLKE